MKSKILSLLSLSVLALVMVAGMASAIVIFSDDFEDGDLTGWSATGWTNTGTYADSTNSASANLSKTISTAGYKTIIIKYDRQLVEDWESADEFKISWSVDGTTFTSLEEVVGTSTDALPDDASFVSKTFNLPVSADNNANFEIKIECTTNAAAESCRVDNISVEGTVTSTLSVPSDITDCSALSSVSGDLSVQIKDINVISGFGDDEDFWYPLDEIEVEIEVENNGDEDMDDITIEWGLYDVDADEWIIDDEESDFNLKDGNDETKYITFKLEDVNDLTSDDYVFYVWANAEIDDDDKTKVCDFDSQDIEITNDDSFVILDDITFPTTATCESEVQITADVWNVGDSDQDEVKVVIFNSELGINKIIEIGDINDYDSEILDTFVEIPSDVEEKTYAISLKVFDEDSDIYETDENNDESEYIIRITLEGCSVSSPALVSANLVSGGKAGENLLVKSTIVNSGTKSATYKINAAGYAEWANSYSVDQTTFTINVGASKEVLFTFDVKEDVSGEKQFNIEVISGNEVTTQTVQVEIEETSSGFAGITGNVFADGNKYLWGIGILNVVLIIFIIIIAVRVARK